MEKLEKEYHVELVWRAFPLDKDVPTEGEPLEQMLARKGFLMPVADMVSQMKVTAESYGLPFGDLETNYSTRLMQEVGLWAQEQGKGGAFQREGFGANFVANQNLMDSAILLQLVEKVGLDPVYGQKVIEERLYSDAVDADWDTAEKEEIVAAPTYIVGDERLVGAQSYENLEQFVLRHGAQWRG